MLYFKHLELVNQYHVSLKTVHNWIDNAKQGRVNLKLHAHNNRTYVANTPENILILAHLAKQGKKFRNALHQKVVEPKSEFYQIYDRREIWDIITNLRVHGEIPREYNYFGGGAINWDNWLQRLANEESPNLLKGTIELLHANMEALDYLLAGKKKVNIVDLGAGNAYPVKELLGHLVDAGTLHRYIAIDISRAMLDIAKRNVRQWYGNKVRFEGYTRNISFEHFDDLLVDDMLADEKGETINLILLLGATPTNFRVFEDVLQPLYSSMGGNDLLIYTDKHDTEASRRYFDFNSSAQPGVNKLSPNHQYILDLMNIDESLYDAEMGFDTVQRMRYVRVRLRTAVTVKFNMGTSVQKVDLEKGDTILLLRVWHMTGLEIIATFEKAGLTLLQSSLSKDREFFMSVSGVNTSSE